MLSRQPSGKTLPLFDWCMYYIHYTRRYKHFSRFCVIVCDCAITPKNGLKQKLPSNKYSRKYQYTEPNVEKFGFISFSLLFFVFCYTTKMFVVIHTTVFFCLLLHHIIIKSQHHFVGLIFRKFSSLWFCCGNLLTTFFHFPA